MDLLTQYDIPYLHPLAVHFPIATLLLAALAALAYLVRGTAVWRVASMVLLGLGAAAAFWARQTGRALRDDVAGEPMVEAIVETHARAADWTLWAALVALALGAVVTALVRRLPEPTEVGRREPTWMRLVVLGAAGVAALLVAYASHLGGLMVWGVPV